MIENVAVDTDVNKFIELAIENYNQKVISFKLCEDPDSFDVLPAD